MTLSFGARLCFENGKWKQYADGTLLLPHQPTEAVPSRRARPLTRTRTRVHYLLTYTSAPLSMAHVYYVVYLVNNTAHFVYHNIFWVLQRELLISHWEVLARRALILLADEV